MAVSRDEVRRIAALARLRIEGEEADRLARDLTLILDHIETLAQADVSVAPAVESMTEGPAPYRDPGVEADPLVWSAETFAPEWRDGFFVVPRLPGVEGMEGGESLA